MSVVPNLQKACSEAIGVSRLDECSPAVQLGHAPMRIGINGRAEILPAC